MEGDANQLAARIPAARVSKNPCTYYGAEAITEVFYQAKLAPSFYASADYQFVQNAAYNEDRGPVHVFAIRGHVSF